MECSYCRRNIQNKGSAQAHQLVCRENPERRKFRRGDGAGAPRGQIPWNKGTRQSTPTYYTEKYSYENVLGENSTYARHSLKARLIRDNKISHVCSECGIGPLWRNKPMPLILDHINGVNNDNRLENLRFVCSNCDTQLDTYKARNKRKK